MTMHAVNRNHQTRSPLRNKIKQDDTNCGDSFRQSPLRERKSEPPAKAEVPLRRKLSKEEIEEKRVLELEELNQIDKVLISEKPEPV